MTARDVILSRINDQPGSDLPDRYRVSQVPVDNLRALFEERLSTLGGRVVEWSDLASLARRTWCVDTAVGSLKPGCGPFERGTSWSADVGITLAAAGVAETGTLLIAHGPSDHRLASLAPPHHIAILKQSDLVLSLDEAFDRLPDGNCVLVTGPSRTADIEGVLVRGVHGPKDLWVILDRA